MLTLRKLAVATPRPILIRALMQCRVNITRATERQDDFGNTIKECAALVRATDGDRFALIMFYEPDKKNLSESKVWAHCSCPYFCVAKGTLVPTSRGMLPIEDVPVGAVVATHAGFKEVVQHHKVGTKEAFTITTKMGYELCGSDAHPVMVLNDDLGLEWKRLWEVKPGDRVALSMKKKPFATEYPEIKFELDRRQVTQRTPPKIPQILNEDLAKVLGYLVAEGAALRHRVEFCNKDPDIEEDYREAFFRCFGEYPLARSPYYHSAEGEWYCQFFGSLGIERGVKSDKKTVPPLVFVAPRSVQQSYLKAYFEGDGSAGNGRQVSAYTISTEMAKQLQLLLNNFGVISSRIGTSYNDYVDPKTKQRVALDRPRTMWRITISGESVDSFVNEIGFVSARKNDVLIGAKRSRKKQRGFPHQGMRNVRRQLKKHRRGGPTGAKYVCVDGTLRNIHLVPDRTLTGLTISSIETYLAKSGDDLALVDPALKSRLESLLSSDAYFDEIVTTTKCEADLYDITVADHHSFVANGFVNHNTFHVETINALKKSSDVINSNGDLPVIRNPRMIPHLCKHLVALAKLAVTAKYKQTGKPKAKQKVPPAKVLRRPGDKPDPTEKTGVKRPPKIKDTPKPGAKKPLAPPRPGPKPPARQGLKRPKQ